MTDISQNGDPPTADLAAKAEAPLGAGSSFGRYVILDTPGAGGMGVVYAAYEPELDRRVAIKILRPEIADAPAQQRLLREAQAMARLSHPNVVMVHDVGTLGEQVFVAMEFVEGVDLHRWLLAARRDPKDTLERFRAASQGLAAAHAAGLVHRDFKAGNVMVGTDRRVRVTDFGLACADPLSSVGPATAMPDPPDAGGDVTSSTSGAAAARQEVPPSTRPSTATPLSAPLTVDGQILGTPGYMAPELFEGLRADERSDQFAFCVALYRALYGVSPWGGGSALEQARRALEGELEPPATTPHVPARVRRAILRGLSPDPADRFPSMLALLRELRYDPRRQRQVRLAAVVAAVTVVAAGTGLQRYLQARGQLCSGGPARLALVWSDQRSQSLHKAFRATGLPFAERAWQSVAEAMETYGRRWVEVYTEMCERTRVRGEQSPELLDRQMACLDLDAAAPLLNRAHLLVHLGRAEEALDDARLAMRLFSDNLGPDHPFVASAGGLVGRLLLVRGEPEAAIGVLEHCLAIQSDSVTDPAVVGTIELELARALVAAGRDVERARRLALAARGRFAAAGEAAGDRLEKADRFIAESL